MQDRGLRISSATLLALPSDGVFTPGRNTHSPALRTARSAGPSKPRKIRNGDHRSNTSPVEKVLRRKTRVCDVPARAAALIRPTLCGNQTNPRTAQSCCCAGDSEMFLSLIQLVSHFEKQSILRQQSQYSSSDSRKMLPEAIMRSFVAFLVARKGNCVQMRCPAAWRLGFRNDFC